MKTVKNEKFVVGKDREGKDSAETMAGLLRACLYQMPQGGFPLEVQRKRLRVLGAIDLAEKSGKDIQLEDADFDTAKECVRAMAWGVLSEGIVKFCEAVIGKE